MQFANSNLKPRNLKPNKLCIDETKLASELKYEAPLVSNSNVRSKQLFPHIYGPLHKNEVIKTVRLHADRSGKFFPPDEILGLADLFLINNQDLRDLKN